MLHDTINQQVMNIATNKNSEHINDYRHLDPNSAPHSRKASSNLSEFKYNEEEIEFHGDPDIVGLVQFNTDMGHVALNVFETYTLFNLLGQGISHIHEKIQETSSQYQVIEQRQKNLISKCDEIEVLLSTIKNGNPNKKLSKIERNQEMRY